MPTTPSKAQQEAEANARAHGERLRGEAPIPANETAAALDAPGDTPADPLEGAPAPQPAPAPEPQAEPKLVQKTSIGDQKRADIMARFRTERPNLGEQDNDEVIAFTKSGGMPAEFRPIEQPEGETVTDPEPAAAAAAEPEPAPAPQKHKVVVHGQEKELTFDELVAKAQIALASENILDSAKSKLKDIEALETDIRNRVQRGDSSGQHQAGPATHPAEPADHSNADPEHHEDPYQKVVEAIQFGDPAEAKTLLRNTIGQESAAATQQALAAERIRQDALAAKKAKEDFEAKHADIAQDPRARAAIEVDIFEQQGEDLKALNVDFNRIRSDGRPATPADIAAFHQILRANGHNVRSPAEMLEKGLDRFMEWKGIKTPEPAADPDPPPAPPQQQQQRSPAPKVVVSVDRQQRRQQPAASPQPSPAQRPAPAPAPRPQDPLEARASVVEQMQQRKQQQRSGSPYVLGAVRRA